MYKKLSVIFLFVIIISTFYYCVNKKPELNINTDQNAEITETEKTEEPVVQTRAEIVIRALKTAYPEKIEKVEFLNDDWALLLRGVWYYYAGGRLLPESELGNSSNYRSMQFYNYPVELPEWVERTDEESRRYSSWTNTGSGGNRSQVQARRSNFFLDSIWQAATQSETERRLINFVFFGKQTRVHQEIQDKLIIIEAKVRDIARTEPEVQTWLNNIGTLESYGWRNIAITDSRSYHAFGLAVDILPKSLGRLQTYWLWTSQYGRDWWNVSYSERYHPPVSVIKTFESYGFVWGGKWQQFDTMHFEYRPEILILAGFTIIGLND